ncbi:MAG: 6-phosphogluconate dehydrogenase [Sphingobacteriales bacterium]|nr:MAG: 6-phosphogluconate dehydrogenase [Sphingobacteriales bacterium]
MRFFKRLLIYALVISVVAAIGYYFFAQMTLSEGSRAGYLVKISKKGVVFKTYEGQLNLAGMGQGGVANMSEENVWNFTAANETVFYELQKQEGKKVALHYKERYKVFPWQGETRYFVYRVETVE